MDPVIVKETLIKVLSQIQADSGPEMPGPDRRNKTDREHSQIRQQSLAGSDHHPRYRDQGRDPQRRKYLCR